MTHQFEATESKQIAWARWDDATDALEIDFKDKTGAKASTYRYEKFTWEDWQEFQRAASKGKHFAFRIRPRFKATKIWTAKEGTIA